MKYQKTKPCPFCGSKETNAVEHPYRLCEYLVQCSRCMATGPLLENKKDAAIMWNRVCELVEKGKQTT